jgi:hypothetical protein
MSVHLGVMAISEGTIVLVFRGRTDMLEALGSVLVVLAFLVLLVVVGSAF